MILNTFSIIYWLFEYTLSLSTYPRFSPIFLFGCLLCTNWFVFLYVLDIKLCLGLLNLLINLGKLASLQHQIFQIMIVFHGFTYLGLLKFLEGLTYFIGYIPKCMWFLNTIINGNFVFDFLVIFFCTILVSKYFAKCTDKFL